MAEVARDDETLIYPSDLNVRNLFCADWRNGCRKEGKVRNEKKNLLCPIQIIDDDLWVLSNRMIRHLYSKLDELDFNFRIFRTPVPTAVEETKCVATRRRTQKRKLKV
jgi:hypothetical protein